MVVVFFKLMVGSALSSYKKRSGPCEKERAKWKKFTACECSKHNTLRDGWVIIFDRVYDITVFAVTHPGFDNAGQVSTALAITRSKSPPPPLSFSLLTSLSFSQTLARTAPRSSSTRTRLPPGSSFRIFR